MKIIMNMIWELNIPTIVMLTKVYEGKVSQALVITEFSTTTNFVLRKSVRSTGQKTTVNHMSLTPRVALQ